MSPPVPMHITCGKALPFWDKNDPEAAAGQVDQCHELAGVSDVAHLRRAHTSALGSQHQKALKIVNRVIKDTKTSTRPLPDQWQAFAYQIRADSRDATGNSTEALADYLKWAEVSPKLAAEPLAKAANMMCRQQKHDQAIKLFNRAMGVDGQKTDPAIYLYRGECFEKMGRWSDAVLDFSEAIGRGEAAAKIMEGAYSITISTSYTERAKCYDKLGKKNLAAADRKTNEKLSRGLADDLFGGGRELAAPKTPEAKSNRR